MIERFWNWRVSVCLVDRNSVFGFVDFFYWEAIVEFNEGAIEGVVIKGLSKYLDSRGWLCELFRKDEVNEEDFPQMAYCSLTYPGVVRGPHAHEDQTDLFFFVGPGNFEIRLWDNRSDSKTKGNFIKFYAGHDRPAFVLVPPGVVHGYKVIGSEPGLVFNAPNRLYAGWGKAGPVDEIRYEEEEDSPFSF